MQALDKTRFKCRNEEQTRSEARDAQPRQRVGSSRRFARRPDPGATRRLCPGRIARALLGFIFEKGLEDEKSGEFRWNCVASILESSRPTPTTRAKSSPAKCRTRH